MQRFSAPPAHSLEASVRCAEVRPTPARASLFRKTAGEFLGACPRSRKFFMLAALVSVDDIGALSLYTTLLDFAQGCEFDHDLLQMFLNNRQNGVGPDRTRPANPSNCIERTASTLGLFDAPHI